MPRPRSSFETKEQRRALRISKRGLRTKILPGVFLCCRKNRSGCVFYVEKYDGAGGYVTTQIGPADDLADKGSPADGVTMFSYEQASRKALMLSDETIRKEKGLPAKDSTVSDILRDYFADYRARSNSTETTKNTAELVARARIENKLGGLLLSDLSQARLRRWLNSMISVSTEGKTDREVSEERQRKQATANRIRTILMSALTFAYENGLASAEQRAEWFKVKPFRLKQQPIRYLKPDEAQRFLKHCDDDFRPLAQAAILTGGRLSELTGLRVEDYDPGQRTIYFAAAKSLKARRVPLSDTGAVFFDSMTAGRSRGEIIFLRADKQLWAKSVQQRPTKRACRRAKISPAIKFNDLRHSFATALASAGVSMKFIADLLGHASTTITEKHYAGLYGGATADAIKKHLPDFGIKPRNVISMHGARRG